MAESQKAEFIRVQGDNLFQLLGPRYAPDSAAYMLLAALVMIPTVWLPDLKTLSSLGVVGVSATLTVTAAIAYTLLSGTAWYSHACSDLRASST